MREPETMANDPADIDAIHFPHIGKEEEAVIGGADLAARFEKQRQSSLRDYFPILMGLFHGDTWLDEAPPEALPEATDSIILAHSARMAIRAVAKVEYAWVLHDRADKTLATVPYNQVIADLIQERDKAVANEQERGLIRKWAANHLTDKRHLQRAELGFARVEEEKADSASV